jgi:predicted ATPase
VLVPSRLEEALAGVDEALHRAEESESLWCMPEVLRIKGELLAQHDGGAAEQILLRSLDWARRQQALTWELRSAATLARLWRKQGRLAEARNLLTPVYCRFTEGRQTFNLQVATLLLDQVT